MNINDITKRLTSIVSETKKYCEYLNKDINDYPSSLGYIFKEYQEDVKNISSKGMALILISIENIKKEDYGKYINAFKNKADRVIKRSNNIEEQLEKMNAIKEKVEKE